MSATAVNERLATLTAAGVSVWLDQIRRSPIEGGELKRMVTERWLRGVTSNPSIFEKAIPGSSHYDDDLRELAADEAVSGLRSTVRARTAAATTFGYGPRFLHSTGQLHKGGMSTGRFLQLVNQPARDVEIPGAGYSFAGLIAAQSASDLQTLRGHDLPAERVVLEGEPAAAVRALTHRIASLLKA